MSPTMLMRRLRLKPDKQLAHGHTEGLWTGPRHVTLCLLTDPGSSRQWPPKRQGSSGLQPHVSQTRSVRHPTHRTAANPKGTKKNSTSERGQAQIRVVPTNRPEIPGMKWWLGGGKRTPQQARLGQIPGLGRTSQEERLGQYQTPGGGVAGDLVSFPETLLHRIRAGWEETGTLDSPQPRTDGQQSTWFGRKPTPGTFFLPQSLWQRILSYGINIEQEQYTRRKLIQQTLNLLCAKKELKTRCIQLEPREYIKEATLQWLDNKLIRS